VASSLAYVRKNVDRMNYPNYRRQGLPVTSATVESLIKQFNQRVKGTEKFWLCGGAETVLQVRAAYLSDDGRGEEFHQHRPRGPLSAKTAYAKSHERSCTPMDAARVMVHKTGANVIFTRMMPREFV
jgi:hypothetical protein